MESARLDFHRLIGAAAPADLRRPTDGARWTNQQLLFHMLFGYLVVRALLVVVRVFGLLPDGASKAFAKLLDSAHRPRPAVVGKHHGPPIGYEGAPARFRAWLRPARRG